MGQKSKVANKKEVVRADLVRAAVAGKTIRQAAREIGVAKSTAFRRMAEPETGALIDSIVAARRKDLRWLFDNALDSLMRDVKVLDKLTFAERQSIRMEVTRLITVCDSTKKNDLPQTMNGPHITFQTLVQFVNSTSPPNMSSGLAKSLDPCIEKFPNPLT